MGTSGGVSSLFSDTPHASDLAYVSFLQMHARPSVPYAHRVATSSSARTFSTSRLLSSPYSTVGPSRGRSGAGRRWPPHPFHHRPMADAIPVDVARTVAAPASPPSNASHTSISL